MMIEDKKTFQVQLFSGVEHGFSLRGNMDVPYERTCFHFLYIQFSPFPFFFLFFFKKKNPFG
jgi:hypothetical protein